jgi:hypothetical protein
MGSLSVNGSGFGSFVKPPLGSTAWPHSPPPKGWEGEGRRERVGSRTLSRTRERWAARPPPEICTSLWWDNEHATGRLTVCEGARDRAGIWIVV